MPISNMHCESSTHNDDTEVRKTEKAAKDKSLKSKQGDEDTTDAKVTAETSSYINADLSRIEDGPHVTAETSRRIACDCSIYGIIEDHEGEPLSIGRKTRSIPPAMRCALRSRDQGCRFSGSLSMP